MSYQIRFTDPSQIITVEDQTINTELSVSFVGKHYVNYAPVIAENFLHLLENFSSTNTPNNPIQGQLWFDKSVGVNYLKIYNGISWKAVGFIQKSTTPPVNPDIGDLWVNPNSATKQLRMYTGSTDPNKKWLLIGPEDSEDSSGLSIVSLYDNNIPPALHEVILLSVRDKNVINSTPQVIAVISQDTFIPQAIYENLADYDEIKSGINLPNTASNNIKLWGTATSAESLIVNNSSIIAEKFLQSDQPNIVTQKFVIDNDQGLTVGKNSELAITSTNTNVNISSENIVFNVIKNNSLIPVLYVDASENIGIKTSNPTEALEVTGTVKVNGTLKINDGLSNLLNLTKDYAVLNVELTAKDINVDKINYTPNLPLVTEEDQLSSTGKFIGKLELISTIMGSWVGTSISSSMNNQSESIAEQLVMSINENSEVVINGWESNEIGSAIRKITQQTGKIFRVSIDIPYVYFYSSEFDVGSSSEYGSQLYSVLVNRSGNIASFTFLANGDSSNTRTRWRNITFFKITDNPADALGIKNAITEINKNWEN